jgi:hypothetical protein
MILEWLEGGSLRSDGMANEVVSFVLRNPEALSELVLGLSDERKVVRGRAADVLEKLARELPERFLEYLPVLLRSSKEDPVPMVRWHLAMLLGYLIEDQKHVIPIQSTLITLLRDPSVFVISWAIVSLCLIGRRYPDCKEDILQEIVSLKDSPSAAIRTKVRMGMELFSNDHRSFPDGWVKSASQRKQAVYGLKRYR